MIQREHRTQAAIYKWTKSAIAAPHLFLSFDAARKSSVNAKQRDAARGIVGGIPDCLCLIEGFPPIWCELKTPGNRPTERQQAMGDTLMRLGCWWSWIDSVEKYALWLQVIGVPLVPNALLQAQQYDGKVDGWIAKAEGRKPRAYAPAAKKPTAARAKKLNAMRAAGLL